MVTFTGPASQSSSSSASASTSNSHAPFFPTSLSSPQASQSQTVPPNQNLQPAFFSSGSLLFGFIFLAVFISFMSCGMVWHRARRHHLGLDRAGGAAGAGEKRIAQERPEIWDVYVGRKGKALTEQLQSWGDVKPLTVQSFPSSGPTTSTKLSTGQISMNDNADNRRSPLTIPGATPPPPPSSTPRQRFFPSRHTLRNLVLMLPPETEPNVQPPITGATEGDDGQRQSASMTQQLQVAVVIAMPDAHRLVREGQASGSSVSAEALRGRREEDEDELVFELGVAQVPLRSSRIADGDEDCTKL